MPGSRCHAPVDVTKYRATVYATRMSAIGGQIREHISVTPQGRKRRFCSLSGDAVRIANGYFPQALRVESPTRHSRAGGNPACCNGIPRLHGDNEMRFQIEANPARFTRCALHTCHNGAMGTTAVDIKSGFRGAQIRPVGGFCSSKFSVFWRSSRAVSSLNRKLG